MESSERRNAGFQGGREGGRRPLVLISHHPSQREGGRARLAPSTGFQIFPLLRFLLMQFVAAPALWGYSLHYHVKAVPGQLLFFYFISSFPCYLSIKQRDKLSCKH